MMRVTNMIQETEREYQGQIMENSGGQEKNKNVEKNKRHQNKMIN